MTKRRPEPWDPMSASALMDRQQWLNEGGDIEMDEAEEESCRDQVITPASWEKPLKMDLPEPPDST